VRFAISIITGCLTGILMIGAYWGGEEITNRAWASEVTETIKHSQLSDLRGCLFAIDSDTMHLVRDLNGQNVRRLAWRITKCDELLDRLGENAQDEETSRVLGEARLFFDGYAKTLNEILARQIKLALLYSSDFTFTPDKMEEAQKLETQQTNQMAEAQTFLHHLEMLIGRAW